YRGGGGARHRRGGPTGGGAGRPHRGSHCQPVGGGALRTRGAGRGHSGPGRQPDPVLRGEEGWTRRRTLGGAHSGARDPVEDGSPHRDGEQTRGSRLGAPPAGGTRGEPDPPGGSSGG